MQTLEQLKDVMKTQLYVAIPKKYKSDFDTITYSTNVSRFLTQSVVLAGLDFITAIIYTIVFLSYEGKLPAFTILAYFIKICIMIIFSIYFSSSKNIVYDSKNFFKRNINIIFPLIHALGEFIIFTGGPKDFTSLVRFFAISFTIAGVPILEQKRSFMIQVLNFVAQSCTIYFLFPKFIVAYSPVFLISSWFIVFICSNLISNVVYSAAVNNFVLQAKEMDTKEKLILANKKLEIISKKDQLTGLSNRRDFNEFIKLNFAENKNKKHDFNIMMIDIDFFKKYNDRFGHLMGDECLIQITRAIKEEINNVEYMFSRFGGEEFAIASFEKNHEEFVKLAEHLRKTVENLKIENPDSRVGAFATVCIGVATGEIESISKVKEISKWADECLYFAKQNGRNQIIHTKFAQKKFMNIKNELLDESSITTFSELVEGSYVDRALKETGSDCTFAYYNNLNIIEFSEMSIESFGMPNSIYAPTFDKIFSFFNDENIEQIKKDLKKKVLNKEVNFAIESKIKTPNNKKMLVLIKGKFVYRDDVLEGAYGSIINLEEMIQYNKFVEKESFLNSITSLPSRKKFYIDMGYQLGIENRKGHIVLIDINDFKRINSMYSHNIGDKVLFETSEILKKLSSDFGSVYNFSVDQFVVVLENADKEKTRIFMDYVTEYFKSQFILIGDLKIKVTFSMCAVDYSSETMNFDELLVNLEITVQKTKYISKTGFNFFEESDKVDYFIKANLEKELKESVENNFEGFLLHYQPIISVKNNVCVGVEALLRFKSKDGSIISPALTIPTLEKTGMMAKVEPWIFQEACTQCKTWIDEGASEKFFIQVNLSTVQISRETLVDEVVGACKVSGLSFKNLRLEVTESSIMQDSSSIKTLNILRDMGIKIAVDDFGTGYSSLSYLRSLPVDEIKIDRSFLNNIDRDNIAKNFLSSIIDMSKSMGYLVCIEGVETSSQKNILEGFETDYFQGFLFSKPVMPDILFEEFIKNESNENLLNYKVV